VVATAQFVAEAARLRDGTDLVRRRQTSSACRVIPWPDRSSVAPGARVEMPGSASIWRSRGLSAAVHFTRPIHRRRPSRPSSASTSMTLPSMKTTPGRNRACTVTRDALLRGDEESLDVATHRSGAGLRHEVAIRRRERVLSPRLSRRQHQLSSSRCAVTVLQPRGFERNRPLKPMIVSPR